jgi:hypothetical protein
MIDDDPARAEHDVAVDFIQGGAFYLHGDIVIVVGSLSVLVGVYAKAYVETLAHHNAEALIKAVSSRSRKTGKTTEMLVGPEDGSAARVVITPDTPDEARLNLLDLDVTADELRGKVLRWDEKAKAWHPEDEPGKISGNTSREA